MDLAESTVPDTTIKIDYCTDIIDSNCESEPKPKSKAQRINPVKHVIDMLDKKNTRKKLPDFGKPIFPTPLQWIEAVKDGEVRAEILCSAELIQVRDLFIENEFH